MRSSEARAVSGAAGTCRPQAAQGEVFGAGQRLAQASAAKLRSLAGRIAYHTLPGLSLREVGARMGSRLWLRGGFPRAFLGRTDAQSMEWRVSFLRTFLERDLPMLGVNVSADTMRRFWTMLAHHHAQLWNASEFGRSFGVADTTVRGYLDKLTAAMVISSSCLGQNIGKGSARAKVYVRDSGLLHAY
jgi:hypothetical protein